MNENLKKLKANLAQSLTNEKDIKAYLRDDKLSNIKILKMAYLPFKDNPKIKLSLVIYPIAAGIIPVIQAFIMYYLVDLISKNTDFRTMILTIISYCLLVFISTMISKQIELRTYATYMDTRLNLFTDASDSIMEMDYGLGENAKFMGEFTRGFECFQSNNQGLEGVYHAMYPLLANLISFIIISVIMARLSPLIFILALISILIQLAIRTYTDKYRHSHMGDLNKVRRKTDSYYSEASDFRFAKDIRLFSYKDKFIEGFKPLVEDVISISRKFIKPEILLSPVLAVVFVSIEALAFYFLTGKIIANEISLKSLTLMITSVAIYSQVISNLVINISETRSNLLYVSDGFDMLRTDLKSDNGDRQIKSPMSIEFSHVSFSYPLSDVNVLEDLSFTIREKEKVAIVGVNGAGKSTIVSLILGLYKPTRGKIYINGIDSEDLDLKKRYAAFATVLQNVEPLAVSIAENVAGTDTNIDRNRVIESLDKAGLSYKLDQLPQGIDTQMTKNIKEDGTLFSGGENQKLAIARALYKKNSYALIMDEPTAALDALAEEKIYSRLDKISEGKTLIFISHRLASTRFCDKIMLLDGGKISEYGTHDELIKRDGLYKQMYESQRKYYKESENEK
ncbi:ABC transporter ATP-binding protein [uncultured Anaerococcus sp.]|uniref:ABC transporter ATP-binding protein n=1 Tax=uncultured Anaerococcus sp. TaxID=293428 RepID=UPI00280A544B|nr:ABC transporter ATP-binding protein [uncultured Anaerococcus sp.]MDU5150062.1 ABC transporter ATP-binding protein [Anaerococcus prevotii]